MYFIKQHPYVALSIFFIAGIALSIGVLISTGLPDIFSLLNSSNIKIILTAILAQIISLLMLGFRLVVIARRFGSLSVIKAFKIAMAGMFINSITPLARIGGEPVKALLLRKQFGGSRSSAIIAIDTLTEVVSAVLVVALVLILFAGKLPYQVSIYFIVFLAIVICLTFIAWKIITNRTYIDRIIHWITKRIAKPGIDYSTMFHEAMNHLAKDKKIMSSALGFSVLAKIFEFIRLWLVFLAIKTILEPSIVVILWAVILVLMLVPWLPGSLGLVELGAVSTLLLFSISSAAATSGIFIDRLISFWFVLIFTFLVTWLSGFSDVLRHRKDEPAGHMHI